MKGVSNKYYFVLLSIGIILLLFVFYFTHVRYTLIQQSNSTVKKTSEEVGAYEELSDDYKSAVIIYASNGLASEKYVEMYAEDAYDVLHDVGQIKDAAEDEESRKSADTLERQLTAQMIWILQEHVGSSQLPDKTADKLNQISVTRAVMDRGEKHVREIAMNHVEQLEQSFLSIYQWLLLLITSSAILIIVVVISILWHVQKGRKNLQRIGVQRGQLDEIAWIQSHKVRSQVANILGMAQLFNHGAQCDKNNAWIIGGITEAAEKLDKIIQDIDLKTRAQEN